MVTKPQDRHGKPGPAIEVEIEVCAHARQIPGIAVSSAAQLIRTANFKGEFKRAVNIAAADQLLNQAHAIAKLFWQGHPKTAYANAPHPARLSNKPGPLSSHLLLFAHCSVFAAPTFAAAFAHARQTGVPKY